MKTYWIRCGLRVNAATPEEAVKIAIKTMGEKPARFLTAVPAESQIKFWRFLLTGR